MHFLTWPTDGSTMKPKTLNPLQMSCTVILTESFHYIFVAVMRICLSYNQNSSGSAATNLI